MKKNYISHTLVGGVCLLVGFLICHLMLLSMNHNNMMSHNTTAMDHSNMNHGEMNPMDMSMADMGAMLEGQTGDALDKAFLEGMIPHHQGAIDMAEYLVDAKHPELRQMGLQIIEAQQAEINQMKQWLEQWGYNN